MTGPLALTQPPKLQFFLPGTTNPLVGGKIFTYAAGTMTKQNTYSNASDTPNTNPIILDANGECVCFLDSTLQYDFWVSPSTDTDPPTNPYYTVGDVGYGTMIDGLAPINSPVFTGEPEAPTPASGDSSTNIATTAFVQQALTALLAGSPTTTTQTPGTLNTTIATTAFVGAEIGKSLSETAFGNTGTWTVPGPTGGTVNVLFRVWGGGGGGGGSVGGSNAGGAGGGGGGFTEGIFALTVGTVVTITIGAGGTAGSGSGAGGAGGSTTVAGTGVSLLASGGSGGAAGTSTSASSGGAGGSGSSGTINLSGGFGNDGYLLTSPFPGTGAGTPFGAPPSSGNGVTPGGGGGGGTSGANAGAPGFVAIHWNAQ